MWSVCRPLVCGSNITPMWLFEQPLKFLLQMQFLKYLPEWHQDVQIFCMLYHSDLFWCFMCFFKTLTSSLLSLNQILITFTSYLSILQTAKSFSWGLIATHGRFLPSRQTPFTYNTRWGTWSPVAHQLHHMWRGGFIEEKDWGWIGEHRVDNGCIEKMKVATWWCMKDMINIHNQAYSSMYTHLCLPSLILSSAPLLGGA